MTKTLAEKYFIKEGFQISVLNPPEDYLTKALTDLPAAVEIHPSLDGEFDQIHYFTASITDLESMVNELKANLKPSGVLWICYPKGTNKAKIKTDLSRDVIWQMLEPKGLKPNHMISIDDTWSAMRLKIVG